MKKTVFIFGFAFCLFLFCWITKQHQDYDKYHLREFTTEDRQRALIEKQVEDILVQSYIDAEQNIQNWKTSEICNGLDDNCEGDLGNSALWCHQQMYKYEQTRF